MEQRDENIRQIDQPETNGAGAAGEPEARASTASRSAAAAYERARNELQSAVNRLRTEVERVDLAQTRMRARNWVRDNPELASLLAIGGGLLIGRLVAGAFRPAPPPTLSARLKTRADLLASQAHRLADEVATAVAGGTLVAGGALARKAHVVSEQAQEIGETISRRAVAAAGAASRGAADLGEQLAEQARNLGESAAHFAESTAHSLEKSTGRMQRRLAKRGRSGVDYAESMLDAARTIVAAGVIRRVNKWLRKTF